MSSKLFINKVVLLIVAILLLSQALTGCSSGQGSSTETTVTADGSTAASSTGETTAEVKPFIWKPDPADPEWKSDTSPVTLSCFINAVYNTRDWNWGKDAISKEITKRTGVTMDGAFATDNDGTKLGLMLASGEKLPDFLIGVKDTMLADLITEKYIYSITELMDQYAPKMREVMLKSTEEFGAEPDGKLYYLGCTMQGSDQLGDPTYVQAGQYAVRADIMNELGNPPLRTPEDLLNVLALVKSRYPEIKYPVYFENFDGGWNGFNWPLYLSFGGRSGYDRISDNYKFWYETPEFLDAYKFANTLYRKGYVNEEIFTLKDKQMNDQLANGEIFLYGVGNYMQIWSANAKLKAIKPDAYYKVIEPIITQGKTYELSQVFTANTWRNVVVTKDSKNPGRAIKYLEFMISSEGQSLFEFGIEGQHYEWKKSGEGIWYPAFTDEMANLIASDFNGMIAKYGIYSWDQYYWIVNIMTDNVFNYGAQFKEANKLQQEANAIYRKYVVVNKMRDASGNTSLANYPDESAISGKIDEFCKNQIPKMVVADTDEEFQKAYDDFITGVKSLGVDRLRRVYIEGAHKYLEMCKKANLVLTD